MGDSISVACCAAIDATWPYMLTKRLGAELEKLAIGGATTESLISMIRTFPSGRTQSQLDEALSLLAESDNVAAVTLAIGPNDIFALRDPDTGQRCFLIPTTSCVELIEETLLIYQANLHFIVGELRAAMDPGTPLLMMNYYFGGPIAELNRIIRSEVDEHGAVLVNVSEYFQNRRSELLAGDGLHKVVPGHRIIADLHTNAVLPDSDGDGLSDLMEGVLSSDPAMTDSDGDGCLDGVEFGPHQGAGGRRDPMNFWDFTSQWTGGIRNGTVTIGDLGAVVARFGTVQDPALTEEEALAEALTAPVATTGYHPSADRSGSAGPNPWNLLPPNGTITVGDIGVIVVQFGHVCA